MIKKRLSDYGDSISKPAYVVIWILFILYICFLLWRLFFYAYGTYFRSPGPLRYNIIPFKTITNYIRYYKYAGFTVWFFNLFGNIIAFIPFGLLLPLLGRKTAGIISTTLAAFVFSLLVEIVQLYTGLGTFDVDDIVLNIIGCIIGYILAWFFTFIISMYKKTRLEDIQIK